MAGAQAGADAVRTEEHCPPAHVYLPCTAQALDGIAHSAIGLLTSIHNQENAPQRWPQASAEVLSSQLCQAGIKTCYHRRRVLGRPCWPQRQGDVCATWVLSVMKGPRVVSQLSEG